MKRFYYLARSVDEADLLIKDLLKSGIGEWHLHGLSHDDVGLYQRHIHPAHFFQRYDIAHMGERGALVGLAISLVWALGIHYFQLIPASFGYPETLFTILVFTLFGGWSGGLAGMGRINYRIARFREDIDRGACLVLVDLHRRQVSSVRQSIMSRHPDVPLAGVSSTFTNPFASPVLNSPSG